MKLRYAALLTMIAATPLLSKEITPSPSIQAESYRYLCDNHKTAIAHYFRSDTPNKESISFLRLDLGNQSYALSEAVSASGSRYIGHHGIDLSHGLVWWEKGNSATLYSFKGDNTRNMRAIYKDCQLLK